MINPNTNEKQFSVKRNATDPTITKQILTQEDKMNVDLMKKIMTENKTTLPSPKTQDWEKIQAKKQKVNELLTNIPTGNITELNELIYINAELFCDEIDVL